VTDVGLFYGHEWQSCFRAPINRKTCWLTATSSVRHHDRPVLALGTRKTVAGLAALVAVERTRAAIVVVQHVVGFARLADHDVVFPLRVDAVATVERALWKKTQRQISTRESRQSRRQRSHRLNVQLFALRGGYRGWPGWLVIAPPPWETKIYYKKYHISGC